MRIYDQIISKMNDSVAAAQIAQITAGEWPLKRPLPQFRFDDEQFIARLFYRRDKGWCLQRYDKNTHETRTFEAATLGEVTQILLTAQAMQEVENQEIESENAAIDAGVPEGIDPQAWKDDPNMQAVWDFITNYREGRDEYALMREYLSPAETERLYKMLLGAVGGPKLNVTANSLALAHRHLLDNSQEYFSLFEKAQAIAARQQTEAEEQARLAAEEDERLLPVEASTPWENLPTRNEDRAKQDAENRKKPIQELRREAIFGGKVISIPVTGNTGRRF